jgi:hypothetical protein
MAGRPGNGALHKRLPGVTFIAGQIKEFNIKSVLSTLRKSEPQRSSESGLRNSSEHLSLINKIIHQQAYNGN